MWVWCGDVLVVVDCWFGVGGGDWFVLCVFGGCSGCGCVLFVR